MDELRQLLPLQTSSVRAVLCGGSVVPVRSQRLAGQAAHSFTVVETGAAELASCYHEPVYSHNILRVL